MTDLLTQLGWKLAPAEPQKRTPDAPPPPPVETDNGSGDDGYAEKVFKAVENLVWMQDQGWKDRIHIQKDLCDKLDVPNSVIRNIVGGMLTDEYPALRKRFIRGS